MDTLKLLDESMIIEKGFHTPKQEGFALLGLLTIYNRRS